MDDKVLGSLKDKKILIIFTEMDDWTDEDKNLSAISVDELVKELNGVGLTDISVRKVVDPIDDVFAEFDPKKTIIFNWSESYGSDGTNYWTIPQHLENLGFTFTGSDSRCLIETIDKVITKKKMLDNNISTPKTKIYEINDGNGWDSFPAIVKPAREHCSTGITREAVVDNQEQLHQRIDYILKEYGPYGVIVEDFIEGNEYNVAVWGNEKPEVLPIGMIDYSGFNDYHDRICSYDAKWSEGSNEWNNTPVICPAPVDEELKRRLEDLAMATYKLFGIRDYARIDIRVRDGVPYVLDVNSNPDITTSGGLVRSMGKAGYSYGAGVAKILAMAASRLAK
jgi:D-alanine-D-alanine ligase